MYRLVNLNDGTADFYSPILVKKVSFESFWQAGSTHSHLKASFNGRCFASNLFFDAVKKIGTRSMSSVV
jgi:hypothetical protein